MSESVRVDRGHVIKLDEMLATSERKRVLVINDDQAILDVFRELLEEEGYEAVLDTLKTGSLQTQYDRVIAERPDVIVLDFLILGEQHGWQFLQLIKMQPKTARVPVVVCTAAVELVRELGAHLTKLHVEVVLKPFEIDNLYEAIARAIKETDGDPWLSDRHQERDDDRREFIRQVSSHASTPSSAAR